MNELRVAYSIASELGEGIGKTAEKQIEAGSEGIDVDVNCLDNVEVPEEVRRNHLIKDNVFDMFSAINLQPHDVFHGWSQHSLAQLLVSKQMGRKDVIQRSSHHILEQKNILENEYLKIFGKQYNPVPNKAINKELKEYKYADVVMVPSKSCKASFEKHGLGDKTVVNNFGVNTNHFEPRDIDNTDEEFRVLFVGGNVVRKGLSNLLKAWRNSDAEGKLLISGTNKAPKNLPKDVELTGYVDDIRTLYNKADVFVLPSLEEGQSLATWEAMAMELPVIISNKTGFNELINNGEEGYIIKPRDTEAIAKYIDELSESESKRTDMGKKARELAINNPWSKHQKRLTETWKKLVD